MEPIVTIILALVVLGLAQVHTSYMLERMKRCLNSVDENMTSIGGAVINLAKDAGWNVEEKDGAAIVSRKQDH